MRQRFHVISLVDEHLIHEIVYSRWVTMIWFSTTSGQNVSDERSALQYRIVGRGNARSLEIVEQLSHNSVIVDRSARSLERLRLQMDHRLIIFQDQHAGDILSHLEKVISSKQHVLQLKSDRTSSENFQSYLFISPFLLSADEACCVKSAESFDTRNLSSVCRGVGHEQSGSMFRDRSCFLCSCMSIDCVSHRMRS